MYEPTETKVKEQMRQRMQMDQEEKVTRVLAKIHLVRSVGRYLHSKRRRWSGNPIN